MRMIDRRSWIERALDDAEEREARIRRYEQLVETGRCIFEDGAIPEEDLTILRRLRDDAEGEGRAA